MEVARTEQWGKLRAPLQEVTGVRSSVKAPKRHEVSRDGSEKFQEERKGEEPEQPLVSLPRCLPREDWQAHDKKDQADWKSAPRVVAGRVHKKQEDRDKGHNDQQTADERTVRRP